MEFGLQTRESKMGSPVVVSNPRKRIEAKAYRARDRMDGGWFRHDADQPSVPADQSPLPNLPCIQQHGRMVMCVNHVCCKCSVAVSSPVFTQQQNNLTPRSASHTEGLRNRNNALGSSSEWYCDTSKPKVPLNDIGSTAQNHVEVASRIQKQLFPMCNENDMEKMSVDVAKHKNHRHHVVSVPPSPNWWPAAGSVSDRCTGVADCPSPRRVGPDAERYWQRNHDGSAKEWYPHEHLVKPVPGPADESDEISEDQDKELTVEGCQMCYKCRGIMSPREGTKRQHKENDPNVVPRARQALAGKFLVASDARMKVMSDD